MPVPGVSKTNISPAAGSTEMAYVLWGDVYTPGNNYDYNRVFRTTNVTSNMDASTMGGTLASLTRAPTTLTWAYLQYGAKTITITANCAWKATIAGDANLSITTVSGAITLSGSGVTGTYGGNGTVVVTRAAVPGNYFATVTITFAYGAGSHTTLTVACSTS